MALLRASSRKIGAEADLAATVGEGEADPSIPHGNALVRFGEAVCRGSDDVDASRDALCEAVGREGFVLAAGIVGIFNGLVRVADSSGIPLDDGTRDHSAGFRASLGLDAFHGAANTDLEAEPETTSDPDDPTRLFA